MEKDLDDCEFWLPPQFLTDDDLLMDFKSDGKDVGSGKLEFGYPTLNLNPNPFWSHSDLSSPVESVVGSTETESDEDDYISGLTRKMAHSTFQEAGFAFENSKGWGLSRSPQSTLCGCKQGSSRGSPNGPSQGSSPPRMNRPEVSMDLLYAAAGEVARIRMMEESSGLYHNKSGGIWAPPPRKTSPVPIGPNNPNLNNPNLNQNQFGSNPAQLSYQQLQVAQFQRLKQQQMMKQGHGGVLGNNKNGYRQFPLNQNQENRARNGPVGPLNLSASAWPTLQQSQQQLSPATTGAHPGSGMRAVFLGNTGPKRECAGTGVFLPRRIGTQAETRKKPGCPVILPDRVVQALNLNLETMDARPKSPLPTTDGAVKYRNNTAAGAQQRRNLKTQATSVAVSQEYQLPQEWTY